MSTSTSTSTDRRAQRREEVGSFPAWPAEAQHSPDQKPGEPFCGCRQADSEASTETQAVRTSGPGQRRAVAALPWPDLDRLQRCSKQDSAGSKADTQIKGTEPRAQKRVCPISQMTFDKGTKIIQERQFFSKGTSTYKNMTIDTDLTSSTERNSNASLA